MDFNFLHIAGIITIFQSILLTFFLLNQRKCTSLSRKVLAAFLSTYAILVFSHIIGSAKAFWDNIIVSVIGHQFIFLIGPLFYFYIKSLFSKEFSFKKTDIIHCLPFMIYLISSTFVKHFYDIHYYYDSFLFYVDGGVCLQLLAYMIASIRLIKEHGYRIKNFFSHTDNSKLSWLRFLLFGFITVWTFKLTIFIVWDVAKNLNWCKDTTTLFFLTTFMFVNTIIYLGLKKPKIFTGQLKYESSVLSESEKNHYMRKIILYTKKEKPYLDPLTSLITFSSALSIPIGYISQVMNESLGQNFRDFLNNYRIEESKRLLMDNSNGGKTILQIAYEVGFNSRSTFNSAFKKHTEMTPKEFRSTHQN